MMLLLFGIMLIFDLLISTIRLYKKEIKFYLDIEKNKAIDNATEQKLLKTLIKDYKSELFDLKKAKEELITNKDDFDELNNKIDKTEKNIHESTQKILKKQEEYKVLSDKVNQLKKQNNIEKLKEKPKDK